MTSATTPSLAGDDPRRAPVTAVMSSPPVTIFFDDDMWTALRTLLSTGLRHLVVIDADGQCQGVLADRYVVAEWPGDAIGARLTRVSQMIGDPAPRLSPGTTIEEAARAMLRYGTDALAIVDDDGRPLGVVTGSDLIRSLANLPEVSDP